MAATAEQIHARLQARLKTLRLGMVHNARRGGYGVMLVFTPNDERDGVLEAVARKMHRAGYAVDKRPHLGGTRLTVCWSGG